MEFLDPEAKKSRNVRLFIGYGLLAIVVGLATTILVYQAQGYSYNRDEGVTRGGLLFVDSKPLSANIILDGKQQNDKTASRFNLSDGEHNITLKIDKYRDWTKKFVIEGGSVKYLLYPRLFPTTIPISVNRVLPNAPSWASQSPDRRWLVQQQKANSVVFSVTDLSDTTKEPLISALPSSIISNATGSYGVLKPVEWSDDNKHLLISQTLPNGTVNYFIFDRENVDESANVTTALKLTGDQRVTLRDKKYDKYYIHSISKGELRNGSLKDALVSAPFLTGVVDFKSHGEDILLYATYVGAQENEANIEVLTSQKDKFLLQPVKRSADNNYLLDIAKFRNSWYYVSGSGPADAVKIYKNPLSKLKSNTFVKALPQMSLRITNPQFVSFSDNARIISIQSGKQFVIFDAEEQRIYRYESPLNIPANLEAKWMDGHRLTLVTDSKVNVFDFDGTNLQTLVASRPEFTPYFDRDYEVLYTLINQADGKVGFQNAELLVE